MTQESANDASGGVTAFSSLKERARGTDASEIAALEAALAELEDEAGDLEDDFIMSATQACHLPMFLSECGVVTVSGVAFRLCATWLMCLLSAPHLTQGCLLL